MPNQESSSLDQCFRCFGPLPEDAKRCPSCNAKILSQMMIGQILVEEGLLRQSELEEALEVQRTTGRRLGNILTEKGFVTEDALAQTLARQFDIPFFDLVDYVIDPVVVTLIPEHLCERYRLIPIMKHGERLIVAFSDPVNQDAISDIHTLTGLKIRIVVSTPSAINRALAAAFDALAVREHSVRRVWGATVHTSPSTSRVKPRLRKVPRSR